MERVVITNKKIILQNSLLFFGALLVFFLIFELWLRYVDDWEPIYKRYCGVQELDEKIGTRLIPNNKITIKTREYTMHVKTNSNGLRDYEYGEKGDAFRILIIGDSFTYGQGVELEETYPKLLETKLNQTGKIEIINAGILAYSTSQELLFLKRIMPIYKPDLILVGFLPISDVKANAKYADKSLLEKHNISISGYDIYNAYRIDEEGCIYIYGSSFFHRIKYFLTKHSFAYGFIKEQFKKTPLYYPLIKVGLISITSPIMDIDIYNSVYSDEVIRHWNLTEDLLKEISEVAKNYNAKAVIIIVPSREQLLLDSEKYDLIKPNRILHEFGVNNNILIIDPLPAFIEANSTLFYPEDTHPNKSGHRILAEIIYNELISKELVALKNE